MDWKIINLSKGVLAMKHTYYMIEWHHQFKRCKTYQERDKVTGLPVKLAAAILGISRGRVYQLLNANKLDVIHVRDEVFGQRVALFITLDSIYRRLRERRGRS